MNLSQHFLTKNDCYIEGDKITVKGLMIHSTGANNPKLSRYVDDPSLGTISSGNWNQPEPGGRKVCVHGFIGLDKEEDVRTIQTLPWNHRGWHAGGSANNTHIGIEICEGNLDDAEYFAKVYKEAVELFAFLCKEFNLTEEDVITHCEGYKEGIASNHGDVMHWFPKHGKNMETFRADIKKELAVKPAAPKPEVNGTYVVESGDTLYSIARDNGVKVDDLVKWNDIANPSVIKPGTKLVVKTPAVAPKPEAPVIKAHIQLTYKRVLRAGSEGADVKQLQVGLNELNFKCGTPDGKFGANTRDAVKRFQSVYLPYDVDGLAGKNTVNKINSLLK